MNAALMDLKHQLEFEGLHPDRIAVIVDEVKGLDEGAYNASDFHAIADELYFAAGHAGYAVETAIARL